MSNILSVSSFDVVSRNTKMLAVGDSHSCALLDNGSVQCWGSGSNGELGNESNDSSPTIPVDVSKINSASVISSGNDQSCAVLNDGKVMCWGRGTYGKLGNGLTSDQNVPVFVSGISSATSVSVGDNHACALLDNGSIQCWGRGYSGQLGNGLSIDQSIPVFVSDINNAKAVSAGGGHTCALLTDGALKCWGRNLEGQLGLGKYSSSTNTPVSVDGILVDGFNNIKQISTGYSHTCVVLANGSVECWGWNYRGQVGFTQNINNATAVAAGYTHTCAVLSDGSIMCWGYGVHGQLGNGSDESESTPVFVSGINSASTISTPSTSGGDQTCTVLTNKAIQCWGNGLKIPKYVVGYGG